MSGGDEARRAQARIEREEFARGHRPPGAEPVLPRPAATVVVARPAPAGYEVLLLERPATSRFAAGAFVFPGGVVDDDDGDPAWTVRIPEVPGAGTAACVAAIRELFEETGLLPVPPAGVPPGRLAEARRALLADEVPFTRIAEELRLDFRGARMAYFARWVTPERLARRYDARFFFAALDDPGARADLTPEHVSEVWRSPGDALEGFRDGRLPMLLPTWKTLERLSEQRSLDAALDALRAAVPATVLPRLRGTGDSLRPVLPGEPGYDEAP